MLLHELDWGSPQRRKLLEHARELGQQVPEDPELDQDNLLIYAIFAALHSTRDVGLAASPIKPRDVAAVLDLYGIDGTERRLEFFSVIQRVDMEVLRHLKTVSEEKKAPGSSQDGKR